VRYAGLAAGRMRHRDHRFEWTRAVFAAWGGRVGEQYGYRVEYRPVGDVDEEVGPSTQLALFTLAGPDESAPDPRSGQAKAEVAA
jgi:hypothetical protein